MLFLNCILAVLDYLYIPLDVLKKNYGISRQYYIIQYYKNELLSHEKTWSDINAY